MHLEGAKDDIRLAVAFQYTDSYTENFFSYVNNIPTHEGGTHEIGFKAAYTKVFNDYARRQGILKEKDSNLSGEDFREGMTCVLSVMVRSPQFEGQTKGRLGNSEVRPVVEALSTELLAAYLEDLRHQEFALTVIEKAVKSAKVREAARRAKEVAPAEIAARGHAAGGQAFQLHGTEGGGERAVHRRGRQRRRQRQAGARPAVPGDPAAARQAAQRRKKAPRSGVAETMSSAPSSPRWAAGIEEDFHALRT